MIGKILKFDLSLFFKSTSTYIYLFVFFGITLLSILGTAGYFDGPSIDSSNKRFLNSPYEISFIIQYFNKFLLFLLPAIIGMNFFKDYTDKAFSIIYSYPIRKGDYLIGKFMSGLLVVLLVCVFILLAIFIAEQILGDSNSQIGAFNFYGYLHALLMFLVPNMLIYGLFIFMIIGMTRNIYAGFITVIFIFLLQTIFENLFSGNNFLLAISDPLGQKAFMYETRNWTLEERNYKGLNFGGVMLYNRLLWFMAASILTVIFYRKFELSHDSRFEFKWKTHLNESSKKKHENVTTKPSNIKIDLSFSSSIKSVFYLSYHSFLFIAKSWMFVILQLLGLMSLVFILHKTSVKGDFIFLPLTRIMLSAPLFFYGIIILLCTFIFSGMLVQRNRMSKMNLLVDSTPTPNWVFLGSTILAICKMQFFMLSLMIVAGMVIQLFNAYTQFEFGLYFFHIYVLSFLPLIIWAVISVFVFTLIPNLYLGMFGLILLWIGRGELHRVGLESRLFNVNAYPQLLYSDLNKYGHILSEYFLLLFYWSAFGFMITILTYFLWKRGAPKSLRDQMVLIWNRISIKVIIMMLLALTLWTVSGFNIYQEEQLLNDGFQNRNQKELLEEIKIKFAEYKHIPQPKITAIDLNLELFPDEQKFKANGSYTLVNFTKDTLSSILIKTGFDEKTTYSLQCDNSVRLKDDLMKLYAHRLEKGLLPKDSLVVNFEIVNRANSKFQKNSGVINNGSFLRSDILPRIGFYYDEDFPDPKDSLSNKKNLYTLDADYLDLKTTISTSGDQTAIAPGSLINKWTENGRNYFQYKTKEPIRFLFAFNSGRYQILEEKYKGIDLRIYSHKNHQVNNSDMLSGLKSAIDYNTKHFGPFPLGSASIIEFPYTEERFSATLMSNSIPSSEMLFVNNTHSKEAKLNLPFYVQAHELTHMWFGDQMIPARAQGAKMLTESLTEYVSLCIYERHFGEKYGRKFLKLQRNRYLEGRSGKSNEENPLYRVGAGEDHIAYGKGAMAFNALSHHIGEESLNQIIRKFYEGYTNQKEVYPRSTDLINHLFSNIDEGFHYIIRDYFESVCFYDLAFEDVENGKLLFNLRKMDGKGNEMVLDKEFKLEIAYYDSNDKLISVESYFVLKGANEIDLPKFENLAYAKLDPNLLLIEQNINDNRIEL